MKFFKWLMVWAALSSPSFAGINNPGVAGGGVATRPFVMNISVLSGGQGAFINNFKNCGQITSTAGYAFPLILNTDGYPTSTPTNTLTCNISSMPTADNPTWHYAGPGTIPINIQGPSGTTTINSDPGGCVGTHSGGNLAISGTNCVVEFTFASAPNTLGIQFPNSGTYTNPSNLIMVRTDELTAFTNGEVFRPVTANMLLASLKSAGATVARFLDWGNIADQNNASQWGSLTQTTAFSYAGKRWEPTAFPGTVESGVAAGAITGTDTYAGPATSVSTSTYVHGQIYQNLVINGNTITAATLSVGGGPAATILNIQGSALSTSGGNAIAANSLNTFVYNKPLGAWIWQSGGLQRGVPIQVETALCIKLSINCWYQFPQMFTQASIASMVAYVRDNLTSLTAYFEWSNEPFNNSASVIHLSQAIGTARSFPDTTINSVDEFALQFRISMGIVTSTWSPRSMASLVRVLAWQTGSGPSNMLIITGTHLTLDGSNNYTSGAATTNYSGAGACTSSNTTSGRPIDCVDAFAYAPYYSGAEIAATDTSYQNTMTDALTAADNYASGNPALMSSALDFVDCDVRGVPTVAFPNCGSRNGTLGGITLAAYAQIGATYASYNTLATTWGVPVINYEDGYEAIAPSAATLATLATAGSYTTCQSGNAANCSTAFANLITAYKNDARFKLMVHDQLMQFMSYSKSKMPAWYDQGPVLNSQWSIYGGVNFNSVAPYKSYDAIQQFTSGF